MAKAGQGRKAPAGSAAAKLKPQKWKLRIAPHLGFPDHDQPCFLNLLGTADPVEHIRLIAHLGFAGVLDNNLKYRPVAVQERMARELDRHKLAVGCFVNQKRPHTLRWGSNEADMRAAIRKEVRASIDVAKRVNG